ncbi:MAG: lipid-A-disaccharide synthase [Acetobacter sp.]|nr:lipid-A-disaccharide synthase [Acetobacter sp.]
MQRKPVCKKSEKSELSSDFSPLIWILAGEASGDLLGARLMEALRCYIPHVRFAGVGGTHMEAQGLVSLFPLQDLAVMGLLEVLPRVWLLSRRLTMAVEDIQTSQPDVVVTIDSPGFALRLLRKIQKMGIPRVHYVAPQVWAWRQKRVKQFAHLWEMLLCLLPFEEDFFRHHGLKTCFVGHPVLQSGADKGNSQRFRRRYGVGEKAPVVILMPGSRRSESARLLPVFKQMLPLLQAKIPDIVPVLPVSAALFSSLEQAIKTWSVRPILITDHQEKYDAFAAAQVALTKSGTSTLELALAGVPMVVTYRVHPITAFLARRLICVPYVAMINVLAGAPIVPELLQENCRPDKLAQALETLLSQPQAAQHQKETFNNVLPTLKAPQGQKPAQAAALALLDILLKNKAAEELNQRSI